MDRNHADQFYYFDKQYFERITETLGDAYRFFYVTYEGEIIAAELVLIGDIYCYSFLGGTRVEFYNMRPNDFLKNTIIEWCVTHNMTAFILGGGYQKDDGIFRYKRAFAPTPNAIVPFYVGKKVHNQEVYNRLVHIHRTSHPDLIDKTYFPEYRAR